MKNTENKYFCKKSFMDELTNKILFEKGKFYELAFYINNEKKYYSKKIPPKPAEGVAIKCEKFTNNGEKTNVINVGFYFDEYPTQTVTTIHMFSDYFITNQELRKKKLKKLNESRG